MNNLKDLRELKKSLQNGLEVVNKRLGAINKTAAEGNFNITRMNTEYGNDLYYYTDTKFNPNEIVTNEVKNNMAKSVEKFVSNLYDTSNLDDLTMWFNYINMCTGYTNKNEFEKLKKKYRCDEDCQNCDELVDKGATMSEIKKIIPKSDFVEWFVDGIEEFTQVGETIGDSNIEYDEGQSKMSSIFAKRIKKHMKKQSKKKY